MTTAREDKIARLPYGLYGAIDGREVLFDRAYRPMWQRVGRGGPVPADPNEWVKFDRQEWFYQDHCSPWQKGRLARAAERRCEDALRAFISGEALPQGIYRIDNVGRWRRGSGDWWLEQRGG